MWEVQGGLSKLNKSSGSASALSVQLNSHIYHTTVQHFNLLITWNTTEVVSHAIYTCEKNIQKISNSTDVAGTVHVLLRTMTI